VPNEPELFFNGERVESQEELGRLLRASTETMEAVERDAKALYGVSDQTASAIVYLRSRSRWTEEKEMELVRRDLAGDPIPLGTVLSGEF